MRKIKKSTQTNYRLSSDALKLVEDVARRSALSKTKVVEACIAAHALTIPGLQRKATRALLGVFASELGADERKH
jgi:hypothetical protein